MYWFSISSWKYYGNAPLEKSWCTLSLYQNWDFHKLVYTDIREISM